MLNEVFIRKAARNAMTKYAAEHDGRNGVAKADVIRIVMDMGGGTDDVHEVMKYVAVQISPIFCSRHLV